VGLLTKIFGNRDDPDAITGEGSEEGSPERETIEIEPLPATDEPQATPERAGRLTFAAPSSDTAAREGASASAPGARRKQRRASRTGSNGGRQRQQQPEVARGRIARPTVSTVDAPGNPFPIPLDASRALPSSPRASSQRASTPSASTPNASTPSAPNASTPNASTPPAAAAAVPAARGKSAAVAAAGSDATRRAAPPKGPEADDPEEIDVSDQLDEVDEGAEEDLDASEHLIIEDDEPRGATGERHENGEGDGAAYPDDEEEEEDTNTSVAIWGAAAGGSPSSSPAAAAAPVVAGSAPVAGSVAAESASPFPINPASSPEHTPTTPIFDPGIAEGRVQGSSTAAAESLGSISPADTLQPDPEWTRMPADTKTKQTVVEAGTEFTGTLKSTCPVVVNGKLEGEVDAPTLSIATTGAVLGTIRAQTLRSFGTLAGNVDAGEVYVSGAVRSKTVIKAKRLEVKLGSLEKGNLEITFGNCDLEVSDTPSSPEVETSGSSGWDLPEADSRVMPARAGVAERARSK